MVEEVYKTSYVSKKSNVYLVPFVLTKEKIDELDLLSEEELITLYEFIGTIFDI
jgi:hypothetical protein